MSVVINNDPNTVTQWLSSDGLVSVLSNNESAWFDSSNGLLPKLSANASAWFDSPNGLLPSLSTIIKKGSRAHSTIIGDVDNNLANGECSYAGGAFATAQGTYSHAEGFHALAEGDRSHAEGTYVTAKNSEYVIGHYNEISQPSHGKAFIIGNGSDNTHRSNAFTVDWDGNVVVQGDIYVRLDEYGESLKLITKNEVNGMISQDANGLTTITSSTAGINLSTDNEGQIYANNNYTPRNNKSLVTKDYITWNNISGKPPVDVVQGALNIGSSTNQQIEIYASGMYIVNERYTPDNNYSVVNKRYVDDLFEVLDIDKADDNAVVHNAGNESIAGMKTFEDITDFKNAITYSGTGQSFDIYSGKGIKLQAAGQIEAFDTASLPYTPVSNNSIATKEYVDEGLTKISTTDPTTSTPARIGQQLYNTTNKTLWICIAKNNTSYKWDKIN